MAADPLLPPLTPPTFLHPVALATLLLGERFEEGLVPKGRDAAARPTRALVQETKKLLVYLESSPQAYETAMVRVLFRLAAQIEDEARHAPEARAVALHALAGRVRRRTTADLPSAKGLVDAF